MGTRFLCTGSVAFGLMLATAGPVIAQQVPGSNGQTPSWNSDYDTSEIWTGFYGGFHAGAGAFSGRTLDWGDDALDDPDGDVNQEAAAALGGVQAGYNWQFGTLITGIEADFSATGFAENRFFGGGNGTDYFVKADMPWMATVRGRMGLASGNTMAYVTAGLAIAQLEHCANDNAPCSTDNSQNIKWDEVRPGIVAGAGVETRLNQNWSLKGEYLYVNIIDTAVVYDDTSDIADGGEQVSFGNQSHQVRLGVNYHIDGLPYEPGDTASNNPWTGLYLGAHAGVGAFSGRALDWGEDAFDDPTGDLNLVAAAALGGVQAGYNWQFGALITGIEADFTATGFAENENSFEPDDDIIGLVEANMPWMATVRARMGLASGNTMAYVTAGLAVAQLEHCANFDDACSTDGDNDISWDEIRPGIVAGAGVETRLNHDWSLKGEYLYVNILDTDVIYDDTEQIGAGGQQVSFGNQSHQVRVGINYHVDGLPYEPGDTAGDNLWTGLYLGAHAGAGAFSGRALDWARSAFDSPDGDLNLEAAAALGGAQAGYNWQSGALVTGIEADFSATGFAENRSMQDANGFVEANMPWMATVRGRMGLASGNTLAYVTAGLAVAQLEHCANEDDLCSTDSNNDIAWDEVRPGIVAGAGVETRFSQNWSFKGEYLYVNILDTDVVYDDTQAIEIGGKQVSFGNQSHQVRVGINRHF